MTREQIAAHAKTVAEQCPPLSNAQRDRIASILRGARGRHRSVTHKRKRQARPSLTPSSRRITRTVLRFRHSWGCVMPADYASDAPNVVPMRRLG